MFLFILTCFVPFYGPGDDDFRLYQHPDSQHTVISFSTRSLNHDRWFSGDKYLHFAVSGGLFVGSYYFQKEVIPSSKKPDFYSAGFAFTLGFGKEWYDAKQPGNHFCIKDMIWNITGIAAGWGFVYITSRK